MSDKYASTGSRREAGQYEIRLAGHLDARWAAWFDGLTLTHESDGTTVLHGPVVDQAALHGLLQKVRDLGLPLVSVIHLDQPTKEEHTMNRFIRRIGDISARRPWTTIGAWAVLAALVVVALRRPRWRVRRRLQRTGQRERRGDRAARGALPRGSRRHRGRRVRRRRRPAAGRLPAGYRLGTVAGRRRSSTSPP